ncbi:MAG TPA: Gfo/Idh/MocA family oxidoreductase [Nitrososphaerales archaeon]|nr:Gfo/Idh/MocA family oxidoreductase [Nitrososphaerales archaeon]
MTRKEMGIGLIGYSIGRVHTHSWLNLRQFYSDSLVSSPRLVAVCGRNKNAVSSFAKHYGYDRIYNDWRELVNDTEINILDNCAPPNLHLEASVNAAEKGKAVLCEKPLARTASEAYEMYRATEKTGQVHMTGFNKRFFPATLYARELVQSGRLGKITHVVATYYNIEMGEGFSNPNLPLTWLFRREIAGHGAMNDLGSHLVDLMRFVIGEISSVCGAIQTFVKERPLPEDTTKKGAVDVEDAIAGCLRFAGGAIGTISVSWMPVSVHDYLALEVYGTEGSFRFCFERPTELEVYLHDDRDFALNGYRTIYCTTREHSLMNQFWPDQGSSYGFEQSFVSEIAHFLSAVERSQSVEPLGASFYDGYLTALINDELAASARDGRWHAIRPEPR